MDHIFTAFIFLVQVFGGVVPQLFKYTPNESLTRLEIEDSFKLDSGLIEEILIGFEKGMLNITTDMRKVMDEVKEERNKFLNDLDNEEIYLVWKNLKREQQCHHINFNMSLLKSSFFSELMTLTFPLKKALLEIEELLFEIRLDFNTTIATAKAINAVCVLRSENCTEQITSILRVKLEDYLCRITVDCKSLNVSEVLEIEQHKTHNILKRESVLMHVCPDGAKIPKKYVCDGSPDCKDKSDELNCENSCNNEFELQCKNKKCVLLISMCDGRDDCGDGTDEENCPVTSTTVMTTTGDYFVCRNMKEISWTLLCDGENDCGDGSDEDCLNFKNTSTKPPPRCNPVEFQCLNGNCINKSKVCDGYSDCFDGSDESILCEKNCTGKLCKNLRCVSLNKICDKVNDCGDNSDEEGCKYPPFNKAMCTLEQEKFLCNNNEQCLDLKNVCNGVNDCNDSSDETPNCNNTTECSAHCTAIGGVCFRHPKGPVCLRHCPDNYANSKGFCIRGESIQYCSRSVLTCLERSRLFMNDLLSGLRLLKLQTWQALSKLNKEISYCLGYSKYHQNAIGTGY